MIYQIKHYHITNYDYLFGYLAGESGLKKVGNDYYFYGDNPNNFIYYNCTNEFDTKTCELWRILGFIYDNETNEYTTKIIRDASIGKYSYSETSQLWKDSAINKYLNEDYKLKNTSYLTEITFKQENLIDLKNNLTNIPLLENTQEDESKVTIMNISDYLNASICQNKSIEEYDSACLKANWLNKNDNLLEWTATTKYEKPYTDPETEEEVIPVNDSMYVVGNEIDVWTVDSKLNVRPIIYLSSRVFTINGNGTINNPYVIR